MKIKKIKKIKNNSKRYDIHVSIDNNFFANDILVHNCTMYNDNIHARSLDSQFANHPSRDYIKGIWGRIKYLIPENTRICGENLYAIHSIEYTDLEDYFQIFSIWFDDVCFSWDDTKQKAKHMGLKTVKEIYRGIYDEEMIKNLDIGDSEGYVIRIADEFHHDFHDELFFGPMAKYVRKNHVQTNEHWLRSWNKTKINKLKNKMENQ